jgi:cation/acetate symporter
VVLTALVLKRFQFHLIDFFAAASQIAYHQKGQLVVRDFLQPGLHYHLPHGPVDLLSLSLMFVFGTAGMPHVLWAMFVIGGFCVLATVLGLAAAVIIGPDSILARGGTNMAGPRLAQAVGGDLLLAFVSAVAFATILAVVAGLMISASTSFAHDFWTNVIHQGRERTAGESVLVARIAALAIGAASVLIATRLGPGLNVVILATFGMVVAASANFPVLALSIYWRRFNTAGAVAGLMVGLLGSLALILASPNFMGVDAANATGGRHLIQAQPWFPYENVGIVSVPLGFLAAVIATLLTKEPAAEAKFDELMVRANTGLGAERTAAH